MLYQQKMYDSLLLSCGLLEPFREINCKEDGSRRQGLGQTIILAISAYGELATTERKATVGMLAAAARTLGLEGSITSKRHSKYSRANPEQYCAHSRAG